jgi:hypothetical protein
VLHDHHQAASGRCAVIRCVSSAGMAPIAVNLSVLLTALHPLYCCPHVCCCCQAFREHLVSGEPAAAELAARFAELAGQESHCSSARRGGDLGEFG